LIPLEVEPVVFRRLKLLQYLQEINLSPEETLALMRRLETDTCRPEDYEALIRIVRAHSTLSADGLEAPPALARPASARRTSGQRQGAKRARRRPRR
jgi:anti-sigma factor RsiW